MMLDDHPTGEATRGHDLPHTLQVSRAMVRIYKGQFGRGPDRVYSHYAGADSIVSFLEGTLTAVERTLTTIDEHQRLREIRMLFQYAAEGEFRRSVEEITGRKVTAFVSGMDTKADVATEVFTLEPKTLLEVGGGDRVAVGAA
jgi:uncharacterized protein YbcI